MSTTAAQSLPDWVTVAEAAIITGVAEQTLQRAAESGLVSSTPLVKRKRDGILLLRVHDLRTAGFFGPPAPPPTVQPAVVAPAQPVALPVASPPQTVALPVASPPQPVALPVAPPQPVALPVASPPQPVAPPPPVAPTRPPTTAPRPAPLPPLEPIARPLVPSSAEQLVLGPEKEPRRLRAPKRKSTVVVAAILVALLAAATLYVTHRPADSPQRPAPIFDGKPSSVAWVVRTQQGSLVAVIGTPRGRPAVALAVPEETVVDLPDGLATVGGTSTSASLSLVAVQAALQRRVGHAVVMSGPQLAGLIDSLTALKVDTEASFPVNATTLGPGPVKLTGPEVLAYLAAADSPEDRTARWEDVLAALFQSPATPTDWRAGLSADDATVIASIMAGARGAQVIEMPTVEAGGGGVQPDRQALDRMLSSSFGPTVSTLIRLVVVNGSGRPGVGKAIATQTAAAGFWVVSAQNATRFNARHTKIVATGDTMVPQAEEVQRLLGVGTTYVSDQETGIADITIVVGRDFQV